MTGKTARARSAAVTVALVGGLAATSLATASAVPSQTCRVVKGILGGEGFAPNQTFTLTVLGRPYMGPPKFTWRVTVRSAADGRLQPNDIGYNPASVGGAVPVSSSIGPVVCPIVSLR